MYIKLRPYIYKVTRRNISEMSTLNTGILTVYTRYYNLSSNGSIIPKAPTWVGRGTYSLKREPNKTGRT